MLGTREPGLAFVLGGLLLWLAFRDGGFFPTTWNFATLVLLWLVAVALLWRADVALGRLDAALLLGLAALVLWTWLSALWSIAPATSVLEGERTLVYLAGGAAVLVVASRSAARSAAIAVLVTATVVCGYALADRLGAGNPLPYNRLGGPVGYWNALGMLAAAGVCLALALTAHEPRRLQRACVGSSVPILVGALYLTFSRGSWVALGIGLAVSAGFDPRRRELAAAAAALALPGLVVVACGASAHALTTPAAPADAVTADAHRLAIVVLLTCAASARLAIYAPRVSAWLPDLPLRRVAMPALACVAVIAVIVAGGPARVPGAAASAFDAAPPSSASNLNSHLFSLSGSSRSDLWHVAITTFTSNPLIGNGAGTYGRLWLMKRPDATTFQDAHNVYLETLTELGAVGLVLLLAVLAVPLIAARRRFAEPYIAALTATYIAFLAHAAIDWDWEMPIVTMCALACGAAIVAAARSDATPLRRGMRVGGLAVALGLAGCALVLLVGNRQLNAAAAGPQQSLEARARAAQRWAPWSPDPPRWLATVRLDRGDRPAARRLLAAAIARDSSDWSLWLQMAAASDGRARTRAVRQAVRLNPKGPELLFTLVQYGLVPPARDPRVRSPGQAIDHARHGRAG